MDFREPGELEEMLIKAGAFRQRRNSARSNAPLEAIITNMLTRRLFAPHTHPNMHTLPSTAQTYARIPCWCVWTSRKSKDKQLRKNVVRPFSRALFSAPPSRFIWKPAAVGAQNNQEQTGSTRAGGKQQAPAYVTPEVRSRSSSKSDDR